MLAFSKKLPKAKTQRNEIVDHVKSQIMDTKKIPATQARHEAIKHLAKFTHLKKINEKHKAALEVLVNGWVAKSPGWG